MDCPEYEKIEGMKPVIAWAYLVDRYLQKVAEAVKPDKLILLTTGAAAKLPEELLVPLFTPAITGAGLKPDVLVLGDFPERALVKGAALGAHIELGRRARWGGFPCGADADHHGKSPPAGDLQAGPALGVQEAGPR